MTAVTEPGIRVVDELAYHADRSTLSVSGAKTLLKSPARFRWERDHKRPATDAMDTGSVCHEMLLHGGDTRIRVCDAYDWRSPKVTKQRDVWRAEGLIAVHRGMFREAAKMRRSTLKDAYLASIFATGTPEQSLYWTDEATGVACRARVDWLRSDVLVDLKTTDYGGVDPDALAKTAANMDWPMQAAHYSDGYESITGVQLPFIFVVIERKPPYFAGVYQPTTADMEAGRDRMRTALERYAEYETYGYPRLTDGIRALPVAPWYGR